MGMRACRLVVCLSLVAVLAAGAGTAQARECSAESRCELAKAKETYEASKEADKERFEEVVEFAHNPSRCDELPRCPPAKEEIAKAKAKYKSRLAKAKARYEARVKRIRERHDSKAEDEREALEEQREREEREHEEF